MARRWQSVQRFGGWKRILALVGTAIASAALTVGMVELAGRFFLTPMLVRYSQNQALKLQLANPKDLGVASLYVPHHYYLYSTRPSYRSADGRVRHNALGCRAEEVPLEKPAGVYRIVAIGGSTTYSTLVRENDAIFTYKLEKALNEWASRTGLRRTFEVLDCGVPGYTSAEALGRYIFSLSEYRPDLVMVQLGINDALPRGLAHISRDYREFSKTWETFDPASDLWFIRRLLRDSVWTQGINFLVRHPFWSQRPDQVAAVSGGKSTAWIFESNMRYLLRLASGDGARVLFLTEHLVVDKASDWRAMPPGRGRFTLEHNALVATIARQERTLFLDLQQELCACKEMMPDGRHLNEEGEGEKARLIFEYLMHQWGSKPGREGPGGRA
jgi:lysophospholipase L1-like esterase